MDLTIKVILLIIFLAVSEFIIGYLAGYTHALLKSIPRYHRKLNRRGTE